MYQCAGYDKIETSGNKYKKPTTPDCVEKEDKIMITVGKFQRDLVVEVNGAQVASCDTLNEVDECAVAIQMSQPFSVITYKYNHDLAWREDEYSNVWSPNNPNYPHH